MNSLNLMGIVDFCGPDEGSYHPRFFRPGVTGDGGLLPGLCDQVSGFIPDPNPPFTVLHKQYVHVSARGPPVYTEIFR